MVTLRPRGLCVDGVWRLCWFVNDARGAACENNRKELYYVMLCVMYLVIWPCDAFNECTNGYHRNIYTSQDKHISQEHKTLSSSRRVVMCRKTSTFVTREFESAGADHHGDTDHPTTSDPAHTPAASSASPDQSDGPTSSLDQSDAPSSSSASTT